MSTAPAPSPPSVVYLDGRINGYLVPRSQLRAPRVPNVRDIEVAAEMPRGSFDGGQTIYCGPPSEFGGGSWG